MLKRNITYVNYEGEKVTEVFYFNLSSTELMELQVSHEGGLGGFLQRIIESNNNKKVVEEFKQIILLAYGVRSEDGKRFIKNDQVREEFTQTAAFDALFMELATSDTAAADFINGVVPQEMREAIAANAEVSKIPGVSPVSSVPLPPGINPGQPTGLQAPRSPLETFPPTISTESTRPI